MLWLLLWLSRWFENSRPFRLRRRRQPSGREEAATETESSLSRNTSEVALENLLRRWDRQFEDGVFGMPVSVSEESIRTVPSLTDVFSARSGHNSGVEHGQDGRQAEMEPGPTRDVRDICHKKVWPLSSSTWTDGRALFRLHFLGELAPCTNVLVQTREDNTANESAFVEPGLACTICLEQVALNETICCGAPICTRCVVAIEHVASGLSLAWRSANVRDNLLERSDPEFELGFDERWVLRPCESQIFEDVAPLFVRAQTRRRCPFCRAPLAARKKGFDSDSSKRSRQTDNKPDDSSRFETDQMACCTQEFSIADRRLQRMNASHW
ncbi:hypothetical protein FVE85_0256 [Porphyridium purpureum]|uniref:RING-type domain-containing protein n=1 Tax=Porphyridium purpureum TaxID=35688 RepID=A0A5J4Z1H7_PORPP|nr:hypothetical protein FVE85_0256 [Porphyridium purpureum]|eukprot:POR9551..scf208_2